MQCHCTAKPKNKPTLYEAVSPDQQTKLCQIREKKFEAKQFFITTTTAYEDDTQRVVKDASEFLTLVAVPDDMAAYLHKGEREKKDGKMVLKPGEVDSNYWSVVDKWVKQVGEGGTPWATR